MRDRRDYDDDRRLSRPDPASQVFGPSLFLLITSGLTVAVLVICVPLDVFFLLNPLPRRGNEPVDPQVVTAVRMVLSFLMILVSAVVFIGAFQMRRLKSYALARAAAIMALIPCLGPCYLLGIPAGIWALVVLAKPEVREAFDQYEEPPEFEDR